ncbi:hypothetical protein AB4851_20685 [Burkholderia sp. 22PA0099]|uniref:hypothetical protein n=1 Tax=Burkholderia sp. 22PA0099 TaxID=3237372 RepID=UPI0039C4AEB0
MTAMKTTISVEHASYIIDRLGGTGAVADLCEIDAAAVSQWRRNGIPKPRIQFLRLARPDVFADLDAELVRRRVARQSGPIHYVS